MLDGEAVEHAEGTFEQLQRGLADIRRGARSRRVLLAATQLGFENDAGELGQSTTSTSWKRISGSGGGSYHRWTSPTPPHPNDLRPTSSLKLLDKTLGILDLFAASRPIWTITEIARELELPVTTVHRIVGALERHGYLMRGEHGGYTLGVGAQELGQRAAASFDLRAVLHKEVRRLARRTGETAILSVYDVRRNASLCVDRVETDHPLRLSIDIGRLTPMHAGANAKALLAHLEPEAEEQALAAARRAGGRDPEEIRGQLAEIRERGYAHSYEETDVGAWGVSAPILTSQHRVVGSLGVAAPTARHSDPVAERIAQQVVTAARRAALLVDRRLEPQRTQEQTAAELSSAPPRRTSHHRKGAQRATS